MYRLILYFPVSALVTLFGNILQNPQDPRARSDTRLMNLVVNFLSMLGTEEENGGVKRMLGVCSEFERIAKVVIDKAEKDSSGRRKRKNHDDQAKTASNSKGPIPNTPNNLKPFTSPTMFASPPNGAPPNPNGGPTEASSMFSPMNRTLSQNPSVAGSSPNWLADPSFSGDGTDFMSPNAGLTPFPDPPGQYGNGRSPMNIGNTFQQPFVPQDLWQMPMTLEWDWADMTGGQYPSFENGVLGDVNGNGNMGNGQ
jgi:hypothetical protein